MKVRDTLQTIARKFDETLAHFFYNEALFIARHPVLVLVLTVLVAGGLGAVGYFRFEEEWNPEELYAPIDSPSSLDKQYVRDEFGYEPLTERILVAGKNKENLLAPEVIKSSLLELLEIWRVIESVELDPPPPVQLSSALQSVCRNAGRGTPCKIQSILDAWEYDEELLRADPDPLATINSGRLMDAYGHSLDLEVVLGGIERTENGTIYSAKAFQIAMQLDQNFEPYEKLVFDILREEQVFTPEQLSRLNRYQELLDDGFDPRAYAFDQDMSRKLKNWGKHHPADLEVYISSLYEVERESQVSIRSDLLWIGLSVILVGVYSNLFLFRNSWLYCKSHMVIFATLSVALAIVSSFGLALGIGVKYNLVVQSVPFLLIGLGLDDAYIIIGALNKVQADLPYQERIATALSSAGASIFVTSITDLVAFLVGMFTNIPALRSFGVYASLGVLFDFLFQVTFFVAIVVLEARREQYFRPSSETQCTSSSNSSSTVSTQVPVTRRLSKVHQEDIHEIKGVKKIVGKGDFDPKKESYGMVFFGDWLPRVLLSKPGKALVLAVEIVVIVMGIYGCTNVYMDFRYKQWFAPKGSQLEEAFSIEEMYFNGDQNPFVLYTKQPESGTYYDYYSNMEDLLLEQKVENPYVAHAPRIKSWFEDYSLWLDEHPWQEIKSQRNSTAFIETINTFLRSQKGSYYRNYIIFDKSRQHITGTIFLEGYSRDLDTGQEAVDFMDSLRETGNDRAPALKPIAFDLMFLFYDGLRVAVEQTVKNVALAGVAVFVLCMLTLADIGGAFLVLLMVALTDVSLFGMMWYLNIHFNMVTSINAILAVGIAVDYSAHITHNFLRQTGDSNTRAREALRIIGPEVFAGGISTWLAAAGLIPAEHYIFEVFFDMITVIVFFGLWHGLILLPVLLSLIGPSSHRE